MRKIRYFLELAYKGTKYHGWQTQANAHTIQDEVNTALTIILRSPVETMGSGRTDTGVHARQQYLHFDVQERVDKTDLIKRLNSVLPKDIAVFSLQEVRIEAHARYAATWRSYEYHISLRKNPFEEELSWQFFNKLDVDKMNEASDLLLKYRDFECFSKVKTNVSHFQCEIKKAYWEQKEQQLIFHITANRFLRGMVRAIVGTLVQVGEQKLDPIDFEAILESKNRRKAGSSAPAYGLYLCRVAYPSSIFI